jgi:hypothetical protein
MFALLLMSLLVFFLILADGDSLPLLFPLFSYLKNLYLKGLLVPNEQSSVTTCDCGFTFTEDAEHIPSGPLLAAVVFYHFAVTEGTEIELTMRSPWGEDHVRYIVSPTDIQEHSPFLWLDVIKSSQSDKATRLSDER